MATGSSSSSSSRRSSKVSLSPPLLPLLPLLLLLPRPGPLPLRFLFRGWACDEKKGERRERASEKRDRRERDRTYFSLPNEKKELSPNCFSVFTFFCSSLSRVFYLSPEEGEDDEEASAAAAAGAEAPSEEEVPSSFPFFSASRSACRSPRTTNRFVSVRRLSAPPCSQSTSARILP